MGRLPKNKIDAIVEMLRQGYTAPEIVQKHGSSESTIYRLKKQYTRARTNKDNHLIRLDVNEDVSYHSRSF